MGVVFHFVLVVSLFIYTTTITQIRGGLAAPMNRNNWNSDPQMRSTPTTPTDSRNNGIHVSEKVDNPDGAPSTVCQIEETMSFDRSDSEDDDEPEPPTESWDHIINEKCSDLFNYFQVAAKGHHSWDLADDEAISIFSTTTTTTTFKTLNTEKEKQQQEDQKLVNDVIMKIESIKLKYTYFLSLQIYSAFFQNSLIEDELHKFPVKKIKQEFIPVSDFLKFHEQLWSSVGCIISLTLSTNYSGLLDQLSRKISIEIGKFLHSHETVEDRWIGLLQIDSFIDFEISKFLKPFFD